MVKEVNWSLARCYELANDAETIEQRDDVLNLFFTDDTDTQIVIKEKQKRAKAICSDCPIRRACLQSALNHEDRFGTWGGADEGEIRKALSVDQFGHPTVRLRLMKCPNCRSTDLKVRTTTQIRKQIRCNNSECRMEWWARKRASVVPVSAEDEKDFYDGEME